MSKYCQNCQNEFIIESDDFEFYNKINVPPPTFCPECRMVRKMMFRNERTLYKRKCGLCGENIISIYQSESPYTVYCHKCWWSDKWDPIDYGKNYDFNKSFFEQWNELNKKVPKIALWNNKSVNSDYCNQSVENKNCYMCFSIAYCEDCAYISTNTMYNKNCIDTYRASRNELCYETINCFGCYNLKFSQDSENCLNSSFLNRCKNCSNCLGGINLRNKSYFLLNKELGKKDFDQALREIDLGSFNNLFKFKEKVNELYSKNVYKFCDLSKCVNVSGDVVRNSRNAKHCFYAYDVEDSKYLALIANGGTKDCYDSTHTYKGAERVYESSSVGDGAKNIFFSLTIIFSNYDIYYSFNCNNCSNLFGCVDLKHKQYCILNKQYAKEQYEELIPKIIENMNKMPYTDKKGRIYGYGEFFPQELSPFAYNETIAQEYFPLTKEQAIEQGYNWKDPETKNYRITLKTEQIPDHIKDIDDSIIDQVIQCSHYDLNKQQTTCNEQCSTAFKIIPKELEFYRKMNLPVPRLCPNCRHYQRVKQRNPLKLWHRQCQCAGKQSDNKIYTNTITHTHHGTEHCPSEFETTYAPERQEIVYCEKCYQEEVA